MEHPTILSLRARPAIHASHKARSDEAVRCGLSRGAGTLAIIFHGARGASNTFAFLNQEINMATCDAKAEMLIRSSAQSCFDAFVNPDTIVKFWLDKTSGPLKPGAKVTWHFMVPGAEETVKVTEFSSPHRLAFDWSDGIHVAMDFKAQGAGATVVSLVASGFKNAEEAVGATEGFSIVLCDLKTLLESGASANLVRDKAELIAAGK
jgi:uncharacterized protein YndB with AHSA1/START domain